MLVPHVEGKAWTKYVREKRAKKRKEEVKKIEKNSM
jgi:hypothetical protein